jgi:hypothetical protein
MISHFFRVRVSHFLQPKNAADILLVATGMTVLLTFQYISQLVGGFKHVFCPFHIWDVILPIDSYFSSWLKPPTRESHVLDPGPGLALSLFSVIPKK